MKKSQWFLVAILSSFLLGCFSNDDYYDNRNIRLTVGDAVTFDAKKEYVTGDTLVFELKFSRYLPEEGFSSLLDIFETTDSEQFGYDFGVSKFSDFSDNFEPINIDPQFILGTRTDTDYFLYYGGSMAALIDDDRQGYTSKVGIVLVETGRFRVDLDYLTLNSGYGYDSDRVEVSIDHIQSEENRLQAEFTVSEP